MLAQKPSLLTNKPKQARVMFSQKTYREKRVAYLSSNIVNKIAFFKGHFVKYFYFGQLTLNQNSTQFLNKVSLRKHK